MSRRRYLNSFQKYFSFIVDEKVSDFHCSFVVDQTGNFPQTLSLHFQGLKGINCSFFLYRWKVQAKQAKHNSFGISNKNENVDKENLISFFLSVFSSTDLNFHIFSSFISFKIACANIKKVSNVPAKEKREKKGKRKFHLKGNFIA